jgi:hypothetical protein
LIERGAQSGCVGAFGRHARTDDDVERRQLLLMRTKTLPYQASYAITVNRTSQISCRDRHAQSSPRQFIGLRVRGEVFIAEAPSSSVSTFELGRAPQSASWLKFKAGRI